MLFIFCYEWRGQRSHGYVANFRCVRLKAVYVFISRFQNAQVLYLVSFLFLNSILRVSESNVQYESLLQTVLLLGGCCPPVTDPY